jgi:hypothetical protein
MVAELTRISNLSFPADQTNIEQALTALQSDTNYNLLITSFSLAGKIPEILH